MNEEELFGVDQRPQQVLVALLRTWRLLQDFATQLKFGSVGSRQSAAKYNSVTSSSCGVLASINFHHSPALVRDLLGNGIAVERVQGLSKIRVRRTFAFTDADATRLGEGRQEIVRVLGIRQLDGSRSQR